MCKSNFSKARETREGWPLLTVETYVNGYSKRTNEREPFPWLVRWACRAGTRDFCSALAAIAGPDPNIFFSSPYTVSVPLSQSPSKLGRQPCWVACLLVCISGHSTLFIVQSLDLKYCQFYLSSAGFYVYSAKIYIDIIQHHKVEPLGTPKDVFLLDNRK